MADDVISDGCNSECR